MDASEWYGAWGKELRQLGESRMSFAKTMTEIYAVESSAFRWDMTDAELAKHIWLVKKARLARLSHVLLVQCVLLDEFEGIVLWRSNDVVFEWFHMSDCSSGSLVFRGAVASDSDWIRQVCTSVRRKNKELSHQPRTPDRETRSK
jgi:hypothetical protein